MISKGTDLTQNGNISRIPGVIEQQFFILLTSKLHEAEILYEPREFERITEDGKIEKTTPDFCIRKRNEIEVFVEITAAQWSPEKDPKEKQKRIMREAAPDVKYVVLYRHNLVEIEAKHPEVSFFGSRKILSDNDDQLLFP